MNFEFFVNSYNICSWLLETYSSMYASMRILQSAMCKALMSLLFPTTSSSLGSIARSVDKLLSNMPSRYTQTSYNKLVNTIEYNNNYLYQSDFE